MKKGFCYGFIITRCTSFIDIEPITQKLVLESKLKSVDAVDSLISKVKEKYSISEDNCNDIWVVLNEAVSNAIKHGNKFDSSKKVRLSLVIMEERYLCFVVSDEGKGFNPESVPDPTSPSRIYEPNGRGIFLIVEEKWKWFLIYSNFNLFFPSSFQTS